MIPTAAGVLACVRTTLAQLELSEDDGRANASVKRALIISLRYLEARESGDRGRPLIVSRIKSALALLSALSTLDGAPTLSNIESLMAALLRDPPAALSDLEFAFDSHLHQFETAIHDLALVDRGFSQRLSAPMMHAIADWEIDDLQLQIDGVSNRQTSSTGNSWERLRVDRFELYLRERFDEPCLQVTDFKRLAGGFGKETVALTVRGIHLDGEFIIRRDHRVNYINNDCHRVADEYVLLKVLLGREFPVPRVLWLETDHCIFCGADFIVMERVLGTTGGNVFGDGQHVDPSIAELLGRVMGQLHSLPPLVELGSLTDSIRPEWWKSSVTQCVTQYLNNYLEMMLTSDHLPSISVTAQLTWLMHNIPLVDESPCLLHGDIGLHNMLIDRGRMTALVDWEFAHIGDPAEDIAYLLNTMGSMLDWPRFMSSYLANGGRLVGLQRILYFRIWGHVRNAAAGNMVYGLFANGSLPDPVAMLVPFEYGKRYIQEAQRLIKEFYADPAQ